MKFFDLIVQLLRKPFPHEESMFSYFKILIVLSLFVTFFLYVFQPFGLSTLDSNSFLICLGFGSMTFVGAMVYELSIGQLLKRTGLKANWTFGKWIGDMMGTMFFISLANFLFARLLFFGYVEWVLFPQMMYGTFTIGIIPVTVLGGIKMMQAEKKYRVIADEINQKQIDTTSVSNNHDLSIFNVPTSQIKYIEALQNYVKIGYVNSEGKLKEQIERATLKNIIDEAEGSSIIKCHRSYLVNREAITTTAGNAQGLLLSLSDCEKTIPVARSYVDFFRQH